MRVTARSDAGAVREVNEDYVVVDQTIGLVVVADGQGGLVTGALAGRLAAEGAKSTLRSSSGDPVARAREALLAIDRTIAEAARSEGASLANSSSCASWLDAPTQAIVTMARAGLGTLAGMHASIVLAMVVDRAVVIGHVGNCRAYLVRDGSAVMLTDDHTPEGLPGVVTQALGFGRPCVPSVRTVSWHDGDRLLLCSDGLHRGVDEQAIAELASDGPTAGAVARLMDFANRRSHDNIAVAVLDLDGEPGLECQNGPVYRVR